MNDVIKAAVTVTVKVVGGQVLVESNLTKPWQAIHLLVEALNIIFQHDAKLRGGVGPPRVVVPTLVIPAKR